MPCITEAGNDGQVYSSLMPLEVNSISLATGYEFRHENQSIYLSKDLCEFVPRRQWPNIILPVPAPIPPQPAPVGLNTQLIRAMQATHDTAVDILHSQGTDPCTVYREKQVEYILNHVKCGHKKCKVCNKELSSTQKLKSHIRATHCHSAAYKCSICSKPFGDPYALTVHKRDHSASARKHVCACTIPVPVIVLSLSAIFVCNINSSELHFQSVALRSQYSDHAPEAVTLH